MKIGILTFHRVMNYGATLQAYALSEVLNSLGSETEILDYRCPNLEKELAYIKNGEKISFSTLAKIIFRMIKRHYFESFMSKYMHISKPIYSYAQLSEVNLLYDVFIVGSDQVWNNGCIKGDTAFFLDFVNSDCRYSYAASIGGGIAEAKEAIDLFQKDLLKFKVISIRENNIYEYTKSNLGDKVRCDVDPVLLLSKSSWEKILSKRNTRKKYLFMYLVGEPCSIIEFAKKYADKHNLIIIDNKKSVLFLKNCSPQNFLSWIYYADTVVTNSFHGTAFSLVFEKNLYVEYKIKNGYNYRAKQLIENLEIFNREIKENDFTDKESIDYIKIKDKLNLLRKDSMSYLSEIVNERDKNR